MTQTASRYSIHGIDLLFTSLSAAIMKPAERHLRHFLHTPEHPNPQLSIAFDAVASHHDIPVSIPSCAKKLFFRSVEEADNTPWTGWPCAVYRDHERVVIDFFSRGLLLIDGPAGTAQGYIVNPETIHPDLCTRFVHSALIELMKWKGFYTLHATALEKDGQGVLIPGASGRGKTTTFLSLLRSGYRCLSDDHPFFQINGQGVKVLAFPVKVDVTRNTINLFPELREANAHLHKGMAKRYLYVEELYPGRTGHTCTPRLMLFPHVVDRSTSWLEPLSKSQALTDLLPQGLLVYSPQVAREEFQALTQLVQQTACYRLHFGRDVLELPRLIDPLLEKARE